MSLYKTPVRVIHREEYTPTFTVELSDPFNRYNDIATVVHTSPSGFQRTIPGNELESQKDSLESWKEPAEDKEAFSQIRSSGRIKMSPYSVGTRSKKFFLVHRKGLEKVVFGSYQLNIPSWGSYGMDPESTFQFDWKPGFPPYERYNITVGPSRIVYSDDVVLQEVDFWSFPSFSAVKSYNLDNVIQSVKSDVATQLHKRWDLLTDIVEGRQTLTMAKTLLSSVRRPLETAKAELAALRRPKGKDSVIATDASIRSKWLGYRYGILPTMYSLQDAMKLISESKHEYLTERSRESITVSSDTSMIPDMECVYTVSHGTIRVNGTAKALFSSPSSRLMGGTSLNVINTMWEVIPYSLVVDWFSNTGDWLYNQSSALVGSSYDSNMCYAVKTDLVTQKYVRLKNQDGSFEDHLLTETVENSYSRVPFTQKDIQLTFNAKFSSYARWLDAYALSIGPLIKALRRLR